MSIPPMMFAVTPDKYTRLESDENVVMGNNWRLETDRDEDFAKRLFDDFSRCRYDIKRLNSPFYNPSFVPARKLLDQMMFRQSPENLLTQEKGLLEVFLAMSKKENRDSTYYETVDVMKCRRENVRSIHYFMARAVIGVLKIARDEENFTDYDCIWSVLRDKNIQVKNLAVPGNAEEKKLNLFTNVAGVIDLMSWEEIDDYIESKSEGLCRLQVSECSRRANGIDYTIMIQNIELEDYLVMPENRDFLVSMYYLVGEFYSKRPDLFSAVTDNLQLFPQLLAEMKGCMVSVTDMNTTDWYCPFSMRRTMLNCAEGALASDVRQCMLTMNYSQLRMSAMGCVNLVVAAYEYAKNIPDDCVYSCGEYRDYYLMEVNETSFNLHEKDALELHNNHSEDSCYFEINGLFRFGRG